ncbi:Integrator complex subunit 11 [Armadillidium nasatum]|uniref:Integrator complex subunit 11 n=1 Tax=Armadillidium nasatum TaxID=96803 RepID=A0A5N5T7Z9_9CRUS|nr:Integrator complex subunit 11 [Armadillidium nasatum]
MPDIKVTPLGAGQDVGRSCILVTIGGKNIMLDCGMHMGYNDERRFPDFSYITEGPLTNHLDCVIISHFHLDHCGALPYMTEMVGYNGPIYMTQPTKALCPVLLEDMRKVAVERKGETNFFTSSMIKDTMKKVITVTLHETVHVDKELEIKAYYAGHVLGASMFHIRVGSQSIVYTGDYNMTPDRHLGAAWIDKCRPDLLISESTYATTIRDSKRCRERDFLKKVHDCVDRGGKVLIPVFALGRVQELCILLDTYWDRMNLKVPVYFTMGLAETANKYYRMFITWTNQKIRRTFVHRNMFDFNHIKPFDKSCIDNPGPMVVFATPGMLHAGLSLTIFKKWAPSEKNMVIMPGYCVQGTVGYKILNGAKKIDFEDKKVIDVNLSVEYMSFSAHADAKGIMQLIRHCEPKNVMLVHGENTKMDFLKQKIMEEFNINCYKPKNGETATIPVTSNFTVDVSLPLLKRSLKAVQTPVIPLSKNIDGPSSYASSSDKRNVTESESENKKQKLLHGVLVMKNNNLRIMGVNEAYNELGVSSHLLTFTERFEMPSRGPVAGLTSSLNSLISQKLPGWPIQTVNESEMSIGESVLINVQDEEYSRILLLSWSYQDESLGTKVLEIIRNAYKL